MKIIERFFNWLLLSSKDSANFSLTIKAGLAWVIAVMAYANLPTYNLPVMSDQIVEAVMILVQWISATVTLYGLWRKIIRTWNGENAVVNDPLSF